MANERLILAIGQLERALTRLETAHSQLSEAATARSGAGNSDIAERHARLKSAAAEALAGMDAILAGKR